MNEFFISRQTQFETEVRVSLVATGVAATLYVACTLAVQALWGPEVAGRSRDTMTKIVTERMSTAAELKVPLDVQLGTGPNWDAAAH